jgi:hypothetical protein
MALSVLLTGHAVSSRDHVAYPSILLILTGRVPEHYDTMLYYKRHSGVLGEDPDLADIHLFPLLLPFHKPMTWQRARANLVSGSIHTSRSSLISLVCILWVDIGHLAGRHGRAERAQRRRQSEPVEPINRYLPSKCIPQKA